MELLSVALEAMKMVDKGGGPTSDPGSDGSYPGGGGGGGTASYNWPKHSDDREGGYGAKGAFYIYY